MKVLQVTVKWSDRADQVTFVATAIAAAALRREDVIGGAEELGVADVVWRTKSNYSAPADKHIVDEISRWHAVVTGVGD